MGGDAESRKHVLSTPVKSVPTLDETNFLGYQIHNNNNTTTNGHIKSQVGTDFSQTLLKEPMLPGKVVLTLHS